MKTRYSPEALLLGMVVFIVCVFQVAQAQTFTVLHSFRNTDGANPVGTLVRDNLGNLYGTTFNGGLLSDGVVFKLDTSANESVLLSFNGADGEMPNAGLILDHSGNLYGPAEEGPGGAGVLFALSQQGNERLLYAFQGGLGRNPRVPEGALLPDPARTSGAFFGTTVVGGNGDCQVGCGTIFELEPAGTGVLRVLYSFSGGADGGTPIGPLVLDTAGNLYGVALTGGNLSCPQEPLRGCGTVFKLTRTGQLTVLHTFDGGADGGGPQPGLLFDSAGNIYGTAEIGGNTNCDLGCGTIYKITPGGQFSVLYAFTGAADGNSPNGGLVRDSEGNLYGTTSQGTTASIWGTVFELEANGEMRVLHSLNGVTDGASPESGLIQDPVGNLYGTTYRGTNLEDQYGTVFKVTP